jgi:N-acetylmuramoyl-L-alanine amidase
MALSVTDQGDSVTFTFEHSACEMRHFSLPSPSRYVVDFFDMKPSVGEPASPSVPSPVPRERTDGRSGKAPLVVLDPGHGGKDPGATAFGLNEKDLVLQIALKMEAELKRLGADVRMTRRDDRYLKLSERTELANRWEADVFVSVHINALPAGRHATGAEIYLMALPSDKDAMQLALIENKELDSNGDASGGSDKRTRLLLQILGDMQQNAKINESTVLAEAMFRRGQQGKLPMRRVAQAPFYVLRGAAMPAVLLEMGFITERSEARLLADPTYQQLLVASLAPGIMDYVKGTP